MESTILQHQVRLIAGDELSSPEQGALVSWLERYSDDRDTFLLNESMESQLHLLARLDQSEAVEGFVSATVSRAKSNWAGKNEVIEPVHITTASRTTSVSRSQFTIAIGTAAVVLIALSLGLYFLDLGSSGSNVTNVDLTYAELTNPDEVSWMLDDGAANRIRITAGNARLQFETGPLVVVYAPATVEAKAPQLLIVDKGKTRIVVPQNAIGFTVTTPRARIVDLGTEFRVDVDNSGATNTAVEKGAVSFEARLEEGGFTEPVKLTPTGLNRASAALSNFAKDVPYVTTVVTGTDGAFDAAVHSQGKVAEFRSRPEYEGFINRASKAAESNPDEFWGNWSEILDPPTNDDGDTPNDRENPPTGPDDQAPNATTPGDPNSAGANARAARLKQLRWMQQQQPNNPAIQALIDSLEQEGAQNDPKNGQEIP